MGILTVQQIEAEMLKDAQNILKRSVARIKKSGGRVGNTEASVENQQAYIEIESNIGDVCYIIDEEIKTARLKIIDKREFEGRYDWDADVYAKPAGCVWFKRY